MELIQKEIPMEHESKEQMWIYKDNKELFNKFSQIEIEKSSIITSIQPKKKIENYSIIKSIEPEKKIENYSIIKSIESEKKIENKSIINSIESEKKIKTKKETPLELIIKYTSTTEKMKQEIKNKLIEFITIPEFGKAFGIKKSAEIISALSRDSWNQSIALFISFLLDSNIIYKEKSYIYNKEKNKKEIIIIC